MLSVWRRYTVLLCYKKFDLTGCFVKCILCVGSSEAFLRFLSPFPLKHLISQADSFSLTFLPADPTAPNVVVTRLTLVCDSAPGPITMDLTGGYRLTGHTEEHTKALGCFKLKGSLSSRYQWALEES